MKFAILILVGLVIYGVINTYFTMRLARSAEERAAAVRIAGFAWIAGAMLLGALLFLPGKQQVLMLIPMLLGAVTISKIWRSTRARIRREQSEMVDLERMKRVN